MFLLHFSMYAHILNRAKTSRLGLGPYCSFLASLAGAFVTGHWVVSPPGVTNPVQSRLVTGSGCELSSVSFTLSSVWQ
jgi:hypothetical protein